MANLITFNAGEKAKSSDVNSNFNALNTEIGTVGTNLNNKADSTAVESLRSTMNANISNLQSEINTLESATNADVKVWGETYGSISLQDNKINTITPSGAITFVLPTISDYTKPHQILVQLQMGATVYTIDLGSNVTYFNGKTPSMSVANEQYDLIYEFDNKVHNWTVGCMTK